jgi:hypothetical protein
MIAHVHFDSWVAVLEYAATGRPLYYQAPLDVSPRRFDAGLGSWTYSLRTSTLRMKPHSTFASPFVADAGHLSRFSRPLA